MIVIPAIDLRDGKCVRMEQGDPSTETVYDGDPVERAKAFEDAGAACLHVVDLDAAFGRGENRAVIQRLCRAVAVPVQVGGGIRTEMAAQALLEGGAGQIVLGTLLVEDERLARNIIRTFGARVIAGIDARGTHVATHGWAEQTPVDRDALVKRVAAWGAGRIVFTEIGRDGTGRGFDLEALAAVARAGDVKITANGGASSIDDLRKLRKAALPNVDSCVIGSALYKGSIDLREAIAAVA